MTVKELKHWITILDFPSGAIMTLITLEYMVLVLHAHLHNRGLDGTLLGFYGTVLGSYAVNKTMRHMKNGEPKTDDVTEVPK